MGATCFVGTNVLVYARDASEPEKQPLAIEWMAALWERRAGRLSHQVLHAYYVTVTRRLQPGLGRDAARGGVRALLAWHPIPADQRVLEAPCGIHVAFRAPDDCGGAAALAPVWRLSRGTTACAKAPLTRAQSRKGWSRGRTDGAPRRGRPETVAAFAVNMRAGPVPSGPGRVSTGRRIPGSLAGGSMEIPMDRVPSTRSRGAGRPTDPPGGRTAAIPGA